MADGQIVIDSTIDIRKASAQLEKLNRKIEKTKQKLETDTARKSALEREIEAITQRWDEANAKMYTYEHTAGTSAEKIRNQREQIAYIQREWNAANKELQSVDAAISKSAQSLEETESQAKDAAAEVEELARRSKKVDLNLSDAAEATRRFNRRIWGLMKRVFVFTVITKALQSVRDWFTKIATSNDELSGKMSQLKGAFLTAAQPIMNVLIPAFSSLLSILTKVVSAIASVISVLFGTTADKSADQAKNLYDEANAISAVGGAASKAEKQLASFDTINKLTDSSGGGGGSSSSNSMLPDFSAIKDYKLPDWLENFLTKLRLTIDDVIFDWKDLTGEQIAEKAIAGLMALCGGVAGFMIAGVPGALVGTLLGLTLGLVIDALTFDHDGKLSKKEVIKMVILALGGIVGGILGFKAGGVKGALIGIMIGVSLAAALNALTFESGTKLSKSEIERLVRTAIIGIVGGVIGVAAGGGLTGALLGFTIGVGVSMLINAIELKTRENVLEQFRDVELENWISGIRDQIEQRAELFVDLRARIDSITGEIDDSTLANFELAQNLIDQIFEMDEADNKTAGQIAIIKEKIEQINNLGLEGLEIAFDDATGHIAQTKEEVQGVMDKLLEQYKLEAMREAYIEAYKAQRDATDNLKGASDELNDALWAQKDALQKVNEKQTEYNELQDEILEKPSFAQDTTELDALGQELEYLKDQLQNASDNVEIAGSKYREYQDAANDAAQKVSDLESGIRSLVDNGLDKQAEATADGANVMTGFSQGITDGAETAVASIKAAAQSMLDAERDFNGIHSPSTTYAQDGAYMMEGLANGITNNAYRVTDAMRDVLNGLASLVERGINNIIDKYNAVAAAINMDTDTTSIRASALSRVSIPRLAQGAVIPPNREFLAVLGDQRSGTNIETPLATMVQAFRQALSEGGYGGQNEAQLVLDGQVLGRIVYKLNKAETSRIGVNLVEG